MAKRTLSIPFQCPLEEYMKQNPELKKEDLQMLREWCEKQPHLPNIPDVYLVMFLHSNYYRVEPAKNTIEQYFTIRTHVPEFFSHRDPLGSKELRKAFQFQTSFILPECTSEGYNVILGRLLDSEPSHFLFNESLRYYFMFVDALLLRMPVSKGWVFIGDCTGVSFGHLGRLSPMGVKKLVCYIQDAIPIRLKGVHWFNAPTVMELVLNMAKPFMNKELMDLIHIHTSIESLKPHVPASALPQDYGGSSPPISKRVPEQIKLVEDLRDWYLEEESVFRVNESLRVGQSKSASDLFGVDGSFKKLDID